MRETGYADFYEMNGKSNIITILTDGEKDPLVLVLGFKLVDSEPQTFAVQADEGRC